MMLRNGHLSYPGCHIQLDHIRELKVVRRFCLSTELSIGGLTVVVQEDATDDGSIGIPDDELLYGTFGVFQCIVVSVRHKWDASGCSHSNSIP